MSKTPRLASFCRLCLTKTQNKVPVFDENNSIGHLLQLIEIEVNSSVEPDAVVCYDCVVTLEGFFQFKEQCHVNDEFVKNIPVEEELSAYSDEEHQEENSDGNRDEEDEESETFDPEDSQSSECIQSKRKASVSATPNKAKKLKPLDANDLEEIEKECAVYNVPSKSTSLPQVEEMLVLAESYPDFFYFEKCHRSTYFSMIFYGERYNSALFTERYTYWQCSHRKKYRCPAQVCVTNDYQTFERRYDHSHKDIKDKEGTLYTPLQALPEIFDTCREVVVRKRAQRRKKLLEKYKKKQSGSVKNKDDTVECSLKEEEEVPLENDEPQDYDYEAEALDSSDE